MMTLSRFIAIMIRNRDATRELERMSLHDQMTGLLNRRGLSNYFMDLPKGISCAFFFGDVNGLKRMNDEHGHEAGDDLIQDGSGHHAAGTASGRQGPCLPHHRYPTWMPSSPRSTVRCTRTRERKSAKTENACPSCMITGLHGEQAFSFYLLVAVGRRGQWLDIFWMAGR